jgi:hypothetical protein
MQKTYVSEIATIREKIAAEHMAAKLALEGLNSGTSRHSFITARMENMGILHEQLHDLVGDEAVALISETIEALPDIPTRSDVLAGLRRELESPEEGERFCKALSEAWKAVDLLKERFGDEQTQKLLFAPSSSLREIPPS